MADPKVDAKAGVKVDAAAAVPAPVPTPAPAAEAKPEEKKASELPVKLDYKSVYFSPELSYTWRGFDNKVDDNHSGLSGGFTIGYPAVIFGDRFYLRVPELTYRREGVSHEGKPEFGKGISSSASVDNVLFGLTFGADIWPYFAPEVSARVGLAHVESIGSEDGKSGLRFGNNRFAYTVDKWGPTFEAQLGLTVPEQGITPWFAIGGKAYCGIGQSTWALSPDSISRSPTDPAIPVSSTYVNCGLGVTGRFGEAAPMYHNRPRDKAPAPMLDERPVIAAPAPVPAAPVIPAGVKAIQDMVEPMKTDVAKVMATEPAKNAAGYAKTTTDAIASKQKSMAKDAAETAMGEYKKAAAGYQAATETVVKAEAALAELKKDMSIKPEHIKLAEEAVAAMRAEKDKLGVETGKAYKSASDAVKAYNGMKGLPKKEKIEFTDKDPTAPAEEAKPAAPKAGGVK